MNKKILGVLITLFVAAQMTMAAPFNSKAKTKRLYNNNNNNNKKRFFFKINKCNYFSTICSII